MTPEPSYSSGVAEMPLLGMTVGEAVDRAAELWPDNEALISPGHGVRWSWRELANRVDELAAGLIALGLKPGDRVGIWSPNRPEWTLTQFAAAKAGLILVTINPGYKVSELDYALTKVGRACLITATTFKSSRYTDMLTELAPELAHARPGHLHASRLPHLRTVIQIGAPACAGAIRFDEVATLATSVDREALAAIGQALRFDDAMNIQFTSGTTGSPKGVILTHHGTLNNGFFVGRRMALTPSDRICIPVPLYHCFGMVLGNLAALTHGAAMVYPGEGFDPVATLTTVTEERCTALYGVPTMFIAELDHPQFSSFDLTTLRTGAIGGASCPVEIMQRIVDAMHMRRVTVVYGMTETSPCSFQSTVDDPLERRVSTVGRPQPYLEAKVVDSNGHVVPRGTTGELCVRGYSIMRGYWEDPDKTAEVIDEGGWMHTGDLATLDGDGYCNIVGRIKDMVIRGGTNLYPLEIEGFLIGHPKIQDVQIFGVPDRLYGEELCAWIRLQPGQNMTQEEVRAYCTGQIAHEKIPRYIEFVDQYPMTATGKVQKFAMREAMRSRLGYATPPP